MHSKLVIHNYYSVHVHSTTTLFLHYSLISAVFVFPAQVVVDLGGLVLFTCFSSQPAQNVDWQINGTSLSDEHRSDGVTVNRDIVIRFENVLAEYNNSRIRCIADTVQSPESILLVQGTYTWYYLLSECAA